MSRVNADIISGRPGHAPQPDPCTHPSPPARPDGKLPTNSHSGPPAARAEGCSRQRGPPRSRADPWKAPAQMPRSGLNPRAHASLCPAEPCDQGVGATACTWRGGPGAPTLSFRASPELGAWKLSPDTASSMEAALQASNPGGLWSFLLPLADHLPSWGSPMSPAKGGRLVSFSQSCCLDNKTRTDGETHPAPKACACLF